MQKGGRLKRDRRVDKNTKSVLALAEFLRTLIQAPTSVSVDDTLVFALKSQGALSKFEDERREILPSSLNTLKRIAESCIPGGFEALDRLRLSALEAVRAERSKANRSTKKDKIGLAKRVNELEAGKQLLLQDLERLTMAFQKSLKQGRNYAKQSNKPSVIALCSREQRDLFDELSLMQAVPTNVVFIGQK